MLDPLVAGKDATEGSSPTLICSPATRADACADAAFFGMHRSEVLNKYGRYIIGTIVNEKPTYVLPTKGALSPVPFAEPAWLSEGFSSPYYNDTHRALQKFMRGL